MVIKIFGRKRKVILLNKNEKLEEGDIYINNFSKRELSIEESFERLKDEKRPYETNSIGDLVSEHPDRIYFRLL